MGDTAGSGAHGPAPDWGSWAKYTPDGIRAAVPLQWAFEYLLDVHVEPGMMACPFHNDSTPSFNLWSPDDDGLPTRYGCFGCGAKGDVITLVQDVRGVLFDEACRIAAEELAPLVGEWTPSLTVTDRHVASPGQLQRTLDIFGAMNDAEFTTLLGFLRSKGLGGEELERYIVNDWGVRGVTELGPTVCIPHRGWDGRLTGIKYRHARSGARWNEDGSSFPDLYGAWRDMKRHHVFIAEGETDTWRAAWDLRETDFEVFGVASGAAQTPSEATLRALEGRALYVCGDGDEPGRDMNLLWAKLGARVTSMPVGKDIGSIGIPVTELIQTTVSGQEYIEWHTSNTLSS